MQLTEEEDQDNIMMIGGIGVFLPFAQDGVEVCVVDGATRTTEQLAMTIRRAEGLEQTLEAAQADEEN
jgi:hypothetical protein